MLRSTQKFLSFPFFPHFSTLVNMCWLNDAEFSKSKLSNDVSNVFLSFLDKEILNVKIYFAKTLWCFSVGYFVRPHLGNRWEFFLRGGNQELRFRFFNWYGSRDLDTAWGRLKVRWKAESSYFQNPKKYFGFWPLFVT